jgi:hypothetical protein
MAACASGVRPTPAPEPVEPAPEPVEPVPDPVPVRFPGEVPVADLSPAYELPEELDPQWCARCTLPSRIAPRIAPGSIDCGAITVTRAEWDGPESAEHTAMRACVRDALASDRPFSAIRVGPGKDSYIGEAWVRDADGRMHVFSYDSDVHGGGSKPGTCPRGSGPSITRAECIAPKATDAQALVACRDRTPAMLVCSARLP